MTDLEAYVCVLPACCEPPEMFDSADKWLKHMQAPHKGQWFCSAASHAVDGPLVFGSEEAFIEHMQQVHPASFTKNQLPGLARASMRSAVPFFDDCPFGDEFPQPQSQPDGNTLFRDGLLQDHVVRHLKELALLSLPPVMGLDEDDPAPFSGRPDIEQSVRSSVFTDEDDDDDSNSEYSFVLKMTGKMSPWGDGIRDDTAEQAVDWTFLGPHWILSDPTQLVVNRETISMILSDARIALDEKMQRKDDVERAFICKEDIETVWRPSSPGPLLELLQFVSWPTTRSGTRLEVLSLLSWIDFGATATNLKHSQNIGMMISELIHIELPAAEHELRRNYGHLMTEKQLKSFLDSQYIFCPLRLPPESSSSAIVADRPIQSRLPFIHSEDLGQSRFGYYSKELVAAKYLLDADGNSNTEVGHIFKIHWRRMC
jgi:hypothetical protein